MAIDKESFLFWPVLKYLWDVLKICVNNMILSSNVLRRSLFVTLSIFASVPCGVIGRQSHLTYLHIVDFA